jgi:hypothetical protein
VSLLRRTVDETAAELEATRAARLAAEADAMAAGATYEDGDAADAAREREAAAHTAHVAARCALFVAEADPYAADAARREALAADDEAAAAAYDAAATQAAERYRNGRRLTEAELAAYKAGRDAADTEAANAAADAARERLHAAADELAEAAGAVVVVAEDDTAGESVRILMSWPDADEGPNLAALEAIAAAAVMRHDDATREAVGLPVRGVPPRADAAPTVTDAQWADAKRRGWGDTREAYAAYRVAKDAADARDAAEDEAPGGFHAQWQEAQDKAAAREAWVDAAMAREARRRNEDEAAAVDAFAAAVAPPDSQAVADTLARAYDAARDVADMLNPRVLCATPGSLEHVAYAALLERVKQPAEELAYRLSHYLVHLPAPSSPMRHAVGDDDEIPW